MYNKVLCYARYYLTWRPIRDERLIYIFDRQVNRDVSLVVCYPLLLALDLGAAKKIGQILWIWPIVYHG
jgi:hypothetical protein